ncbi:MBL fold metallo-hydrolase [Butyrivibrio sp.]|jgi:L-ascorbate metabolism protein UlaG (beta-lactamase superfamily)|uniref:MBL fold metallo-hydrolase n=1 Tax=Butyrivibrio sp. TaxID=28121 RepID=UPI0025BC2EFD|nr:MBL fold metallo-hydrolase [Butyrivibrio sp.]MBE5838918.1 MBL fold metallo-hydrolase [Butyrivibrio sp.]
MLDNIEVFTQSSIRIKSSQGTIYLDPFQIKTEPHDADYILITHDHYDHFSVDDIKKIAKISTILVVPARMEDDAKELANDVASIVTVKPGVYKEISGLEIETIPAYNTVKPFHPRRAEWVGYILRADGKRIYVAGDTGLTKEARQVKCDIALLPVGGTYTMDTRRAAELANTIRPEYVIPTHYGSIVGKQSDGQTFASLVKSPVKVVEKIKFD